MSTQALESDPSNTEAAKLEVPSGVSQSQQATMNGPAARKTQLLSRMIGSRSRSLMAKSTTSSLPITPYRGKNGRGDQIGVGPFIAVILSGTQRNEE